MLKATKQTGFSLIELMIAMTIGLFILGGTVAIFGALTRVSSETLRASRLNHDLRSTMELMVADIRRAGYWSGLTPDTVAANPFTAAAVDIALGEAGGQPANSCILYAYDIGVDGVVDDGSAGTTNDRFGFRLRNGVVEMRAGGAGDFNCDDGQWEALTQANSVQVTALAFDADGSLCINAGYSPGVLCDSVTPVSEDVLVTVREVNIRLEAENPTTPNIRASLVNTVRVKNDKIEVTP